jgi:hypothetical protein
MKPHSFKFFAAFALTVGLGLTGCQQPVAATAPADTPAPTTTVIENVHHDDDARKMQDRDHPRPDDNARRDHPEGEPGR